MQSRSRTVIAMLMAAVSVSAVGMVQFAMADGIERPRRAARVAPVGPPPVTPEVPALLGEAPVEEPCITREAALQLIALASQGVPPETLQAALANLSGQTSRSAISPEAAVLSDRLRVDLARIEECDTVQMAVTDATQVAAVTSEATATTETPGRPEPLSPSYSTVPMGEPEGADGSGYKHLG
ncbi:MAG: hypothetical protein ACREH4_00495 [Vitreimonas sp.]